MQIPVGASSEIGPLPGSQFEEFVRFCCGQTGENFPDPAVFQDFSVARYRDFWRLFLEWADPPRSGSADPVCTDDRCERASFFPNLELSYAECLLGAGGTEGDERPAIVARRSGEPTQRLSRGELRESVRSVAARLRELGFGEGDRVAAIATNTPEAAIGALAAAAIGATFSSAAPEMGAPAILNRFEQLEPALLMANFEGGRGNAPGDVAERVASVAASLPSLRAVIALDGGEVPERIAAHAHRLAELRAKPPVASQEQGWERYPFNQPLFILFTSGTTGPPKCLVHGAGGTLVEHLKEHRLHSDLGSEDTLFFQTSTAWMMWNWQLSALASGATIVLFDGPLAGPETLWQIVAEEEVTVFGTSPPYLQLCEDSGYSPRREGAPRHLRSLLSTGSVLRDWQFDWVREEVGQMALQSISGGTDIIGCFFLGHPELPVRRGRLQSPSLGMDVAALASEATPSGSAIGELVCRNPFPSRPLGLLGDNGSRFHDAYFSQNEGVWTHGDLVELDADGQARIHGRSDGVLNIQGVRIGPSEIYQALRDVPEVREAMAVEQRREDGSRLVLLVVMAPGAELDGALSLRIRRIVARHATSLHVPELIVAVPELPVTHSGKRSERAGQRAVEGRAAENARALANPESIGLIAAAVGEAEAARERLELPVATPGLPTAEQLRAAWEAVLGVRGIGFQDDFFALGGTSLQAIQVFFFIRERLGVELPPSTMIQVPTVAGLAAVIDDPPRHFDPLILIRPGSQGPPLYLIHDIWGDVLGMRQLATAMSADVSVYGLRARGLGTGESPQTSVEEMAATFLEVIRSHQPQGPYRLAGHSFGGLLAFELARLLSDAGEVIDWLGLIDAELSTRSLPVARRWRRRAALPFHLARAGLNHPRRAVRFLLHAEDWMEEASPAHRHLAAVFLSAAADFRPRPYRGSMTYFLPQVRRFHLFPDPVPVWRGVTAGAFVLERVPGPHVGMVSGPQAEILAAKIDAHLERRPARTEGAGRGGPEADSVVST